MKSSEKILKKLNNLLILNYEIETVYLDALDLAADNHLKAFFRERGFERNEFSRQLRSEIVKLKSKPKQFKGLSANFDKIWTNFKDFVLLNNEADLMEMVYGLKRLSIEKYNELLMEINLPLSVCKLLVKHRDSIYSNMNAMKRHEEFVV